MSLPTQFTCTACGKVHPFTTLLEFPLPENIQRVSSGQVDGDLTVIAKHAYRLNKHLFLLTSLRLPIRGHMDDFEIQNWVHVAPEEVERLRAAIAAVRHDPPADFSARLTGRMVYPIPMYGLSDHPLVTFLYPPADLYAPVQLVESTERIYRDWRDGITPERVEAFLTFLHH